MNFIAKLIVIVAFVGMAFAALPADCPSLFENATTCTATVVSACADGFYASTPNDTFCNACIDNCKTCTGPAIGDCTVGMDGYSYVSGALVTCVTGCSVCTTTSDCTSTTKKGFSVDGTNGFVTCTTGCDVCTNTGAGDCTTAANGYDGTSTLYTCVDANCYTCAGASGNLAACTATTKPGYSVDGTNGYVTCTANCAVCTNTGAGDCTTALDGYFGTATLTKCDDGCATCAAAGSCTACADGFWFNASLDKCAALETYIPGCTEGNYLKCKACGDGYFLATDTCTACSANCTTCTDASTCTVCATDYKVKSGACEKSSGGGSGSSASVLAFSSLALAVLALLM